MTDDARDDTTATVNRSAKLCLTCEHCVWRRPGDWKPRYQGDYFRTHDVINQINAKRHHVAAHCALNPVWLEVSTAHWCAQHKFREPFGAALFVTETDVLYGPRRIAGVDEERRQIADLKRQLKLVREKSAKRFARLKALDGTEK